jgi:hypothetical protein
MAFAQPGGEGMLFLHLLAHALDIATPLYAVWDPKTVVLGDFPTDPPPLPQQDTMDKETVTDQECALIDGKAAGLSLSLPSNNPFRNRTTSPVANGQLSPMEPPPRPLSRNPFLDDAGTVKESLQRLPSPSSNPAPLTGSAAELFVRTPHLPIPRS